MGVFHSPKASIIVYSDVKGKRSALLMGYHFSSNMSFSALCKVGPAGVSSLSSSWSRSL